MTRPAPATVLEKLSAIRTRLRGPSEEDELRLRAEKLLRALDRFDDIVDRLPPPPRPAPRRPVHDMIPLAVVQQSIDAQHLGYCGRIREYDADGPIRWIVCEQRGGHEGDCGLTRERAS